MDKMDLGKIKSITPQTIGSWLAVFWCRFFKLLLALFSLAIIIWGAYIWYSSLYQPQWSDSEKNDFLNSQSLENNLKTDLLEKIIQRIDSSQAKFNQEIFQGKNIFKTY